MDKKRQVLFLLFFIVLVGALTFGFLYLREEKQNEDIYDKMAQEQQQEETVTETPTPEVTEESTIEDPAVSKPEIPIDFEKLQQENPDIYAWIRIPDTKIDYPVVQSPTDDAYYLNHTVEKKEGLPGSIYSESQNAKDFSDPNTVLYGHNMRNGSMFAGLHEYSDADYMAKHNEITVYTPEHILTYRVFAAVVYDNRHILNTINFREPTEFQAYLDSLKNARNMSNAYDDTVNVTTDDRLLTLSTCNSNSEQRFILEAVLINEE